MNFFALRVFMLILIIVFSVIGVGFPFWIVRRGGSNILNTKIFDNLQCFAVGLICGVSVLHIFADAQEDLSQLNEFPIAGTVALLGCFTMLALNRIVTLIAARHSSEHSEHDHHDQSSARDLSIAVHTAHSAEGSSASRAGTVQRPMTEDASGSFHGHTHQRLLLDPALGTGIAARIKAYLLELAIAVHSILVGLSVGLIDENSSKTPVIDVSILGIAVCFHQLFEGIAVGNQGVRVGFNFEAGAVMVCMYTFSCPLGGVAGIAIASSLDTSSEHALWVIGLLNAFAAGTLIEIGFVDMLPELFSHKHGSEEKISLRDEFTRLFSLFCGAAIMAVLAIWA